MRTLVVFLLIFSVIVVFHEFGHYYFAKKSGIRVREFALGMGPKLFSKQDKDGTTYTLRMLPLGGYVRLAGLNEEDGLQAGMQIGLSLDETGVVNVINLSDKLSVDQLPVQVDAFDLIDAMEIQAIPIGEEERMTYQVDPNAFIIEKDGTKVLVSPRETRYESASPWNKIKTNIAGPINNFILSIVIFIGVGFAAGGVASNQAIIGQVQEGSPAYVAGLMEGDKVLSVDGQAISDWNQLVTSIQSRPNQKVDFILERDGKQISLNIEIKAVESSEGSSEYGQIGIIRSRETSPFAILGFGFTQTWAVVTMVLDAILGMFSRGFDVNQFGGPVAMAQMTNQVVDHGSFATLSFMAMISANLGIMNLLPIPALDGGKIILNVYEALRGKPLAQEKEGIITLIGVGFLVILMLVVTWNDIMRAFF